MSHGIGIMEFQFDAYTVNDEFAVNCSNEMVQRERKCILERSADIDAPIQEKLDDEHADNLFQIRLLMENLKWLMNEGVQEPLSDVMLYYLDDMSAGYAWYISGKVGAHTANERGFEIGFQNTWYQDIGIYVAGEVIRTIEVPPDE